MKIAFETDNWINMYSTATVLGKSDNSVSFRVVANSTTSPAYQLVVTTQGYVGISTGIPQAKFHVSGGDIQVGDGSASTISASGYMTFANLGSAPAASPGRVYYDSLSNKLRLSTGTAWADVASGAPSGCSVVLSHNQTLQTEAQGYADIQFDSVEYDLNGEFNASNYRFTAKQAGVYLLTCTMTLTNSVSGDLYVVSINKNGSPLDKTSFRANGTYDGMTAVRALYLAAGDYVEFKAASAGPEGRIIYGGESTTRATISRLQ